jgi:hypothetical protein
MLDLPVLYVCTQQQDLSMVMNLLYIKQHQARALLIHHRWKMESILDHFDRKGRDRMLREAGVVIQQQAEEKNGGGMAMAASPSLPPCPRSSVTCYVCFEDVSSDAVSTMDCGHCFCNDCKLHVFLHFIVSLFSFCSVKLHQKNFINCICEELITVFMKKKNYRIWFLPHLHCPVLFS